MSWALRVGHHDRVGFGVSRRTGAGVAAVVFAAGAGVQAALSTDPPGWLAFGLVLLSVPVLTGLLIAWRAPGSLVGPVLCWVGAAPSAVFALELWGETVDRPHPWPGAGAVHAVAVGAWVWNLAGFAALCLVFPTGLRPGRRWRVVAGAAGAAGVAVNALASWATLDTARFDGLPVPAQVAVVVPAYAALLAALGACVAALVARYRDGDRRTRQQIRWLALGAGTVPVLLAAGWALQAAGAPTTVAYPAFLVAMLVAVPAAVAVAVLRHDLLDVDRLLGASLAWLLTSVVSAAIFAAIVVGAAELFGHAGASGVVGAAFVTALCLLPLHRRLHDAVGRVVDRERYVIAGRAQQFVREVRDGTREPEGAEALLRDLLADPELRLLIRLPGRDGYLDLAGQPATPEAGAAVLPLRTGAAEVGVVVPGNPSTRRLRLAREIARQIRLPIEVSRLRLELRAALADVTASRARLVSAAADERQRLERDLHDGAQQQIVAVGMRLRSVQRRLAAGSAEHAELDGAVEALETTIAELRRLAHGVRPQRLDDGLAAALRALVTDAPLPVALSVTPTPLPEVYATTVYFVVAEALANAFKHARATGVTVTVDAPAEGVRVEVADDGVGGATGGLASVRDRVASLGGRLTVASPPGAGTRICVEIPHAHRAG